MAPEERMKGRGWLRAPARVILACILFLPQISWRIATEWPALSPAAIVECAFLILGAGAAIVPRPQVVQTVGLGLLVLNPTVFTLMTAAFGSVNLHGRTGIELFGLIGFSWGAAFVCAYWMNRWLDAFGSGRPARKLSTAALLTVVVLLCVPSILGELGQLLLRLSYPNGLIPENTLWGKAMIWVMLVSAPAALLGLGLLVLAAPITVHLVKTRGLSSPASRGAVIVGALALLSAALWLNWGRPTSGCI
jgi:hypothetical protein